MYYKKTLIALTIILGVMITSAQAFTITKIGTVESSEYNEIMDKFYKNDVTVWAGVDPDGFKYVKFNFDGGLKDLDFGLWQPDDTEVTSTLYGYLKWEKVLNKAIEWGEVAKTNQVDHSADIGDCSTADIKCKARFVSISNGKTIYVVFDMEDKDNQFYTADPVIKLVDIIKMNNMFTKQVPAHWERVKNKATKDTSDLFN